MARSIHFSGPRKNKPFAPVDCSSLVPTLIESELFGYVKGAFTGAQHSKQGLFEAAGEGTLFLDEIGDLPIDLQAKLLRALQEREIKPVGSNERIGIRARVIAATNRDLESAHPHRRISPGSVFPAERSANQTAAAARAQSGHSAAGQHVSRKIFRSGAADPHDFRRRHAPHHELMTGRAISANWRMPSNAPWRWAPGRFCMWEICRRIFNFPPRKNGGRGRTGAAEALERRAIFRALQETSGDKLAAARLLGIGKTTLYRKLKQYESGQTQA